MPLGARKKNSKPLGSPDRDLPFALRDSMTTTDGAAVAKTDENESFSCFSNPCGAGAGLVEGSEAIEIAADRKRKGISFFMRGNIHTPATTASGRGNFYFPQHRASALRDSRCERMKRLGTHKPTKIPNRSPWARSSLEEANQTAIEVKIEIIPAMRQSSPRTLRLE